MVQYQEINIILNINNIIKYYCLHILKYIYISLDREDPLEKEMATHSTILAWEIPRTEEFGGLQSMGSQRVGHN